MYRKTLATAATLLLTVAIGTPATAQQLTRIVSYHDLDLTKPQGVKTLRHRLTRAANYVCRFASAGDDLLKSENQDCREQVMRETHPKLLGAIELAQQRAAATQFASR
jgi:UrcA family protein